MGAFKIEIVGVGGHGCDRKAKSGEKLYGRCGRFTCPDCMAYEFVQRMKQAGMVRVGEQAYSVQVVAADSPLPLGATHIFESPDGTHWASVPMRALFTHWPETPTQVVDDLLSNERKAGQF